MSIGNDWIAALSHEARPVEAPKPPRSFAEMYPREFAWINSSSFDFALAMRETLKRYPTLTPKQLAAVQKCMAFRQAPTEDPVLTSGLDLSKLPEGRYAVPGGPRQKFQVAKPDGKWLGWTFVSDAAEYGNRQRIGVQPYNAFYRGTHEQDLRIIAADPQAASAAYGKLTGTCGVCGRPLENEESVARGIGPICAGRMGW